MKNHHPGLATLFCTEMWERFSYYGMRALLVLFLVAAVESGGMGLTDQTAAAIYGLYTASVYLFALPCGWAADRLFGLKRAVFMGGVSIIIGHIFLTFTTGTPFFVGLVFVVLGTGLLKPSATTLVGELYKNDEARRDAGFSIYYMGINIGGIAGPLLCGWLGQQYGWHVGFAAAGVGMTLGLVQYKLMAARLASVGAEPQPRAREWQLGGTAMAIIAIIVGLAASGVMAIDPVYLAGRGGVAIATVFVIYFLGMYLAGGLDREEKQRLLALGVLFLFCALFFAGFEQAGSSFNLFAERYTDRALFGFTFPSTWLQSANPLFILIMAPVFAAMWVKLAARNLNPSAPLKFALGLLMLGLGFGVMAIAAKAAMTGEQVLPTWLLATYFLHTLGELCLSPIGLSLTSRLAPKRFAAQTMGLFFISVAIGNLFAGLIAGRLSEDMGSIFSEMFLYCLGAAACLFVIRKWVARLSGEGQPPTVSQELAARETPCGA